METLFLVLTNIGLLRFPHYKDKLPDKYIPITGVILTKMDGTARGGIAIQIMKELNLPVYFIGVGEQVDDLVPFDRESYINGLISNEKEMVND